LLLNFMQRPTISRWWLRARASTCTRCGLAAPTPSSYRLTLPTVGARYGPFLSVEQLLAR
jgi:hypothetical protein